MPDNPSSLAASPHVIFGLANCEGALRNVIAHVDPIVEARAPTSDSALAAFGAPLHFLLSSDPVPNILAHAPPLRLT